jgi:NAD(P)-dependent dehydrogenase (short-subunit alcohol dehydrogenase family)
MRVAVVGATRGMGRAVARRYAERGASVAVLGRDAEALARAAADLDVRGAAEVACVVLDLADCDRHGPALEEAMAKLGGLDVVVVTAASFGTQDALEADRARLLSLLHLDFVATIAFCEEARHRLLARGGGTLVVFSSVAGDRGRKTVGLYGAAKAGLGHYLEALDARYRAAGLVTVDVRPGFIHTDMTAGLPAPPFAGLPDEVAASVVDAVDRGLPRVYTPRMWGLVMLVIRWLPRFVLRRVGF